MTQTAPTTLSEYPERTHRLAVVIGRFQPLHNGHLALIERALKRADRVLVIVGSANRAQDLRNPWTASFRRTLVHSALFARNHNMARISIAHADDILYDDDAWIAQIETIVRQHVRPEEKESILLVGHDRDETSYYLSAFSWPVLNCEDINGVSGTQFREAYFAQQPAEDWTQWVPACVRAALFQWMLTSRYRELRADLDVIQNLREVYGTGPFKTVDALVTCHDHLLLIRRGNRPSRGTLALPGGFVEQNEPLYKAALRELREETGLDVPLQSLVTYKAFDAPSRSLRGRIVTTCFHFDISSLIDTDTALPPIAGADDAADAQWVRIDPWTPIDRQLLPSAFFEDHAFIIHDILR